MQAPFRTRRDIRQLTAVGRKLGHIDCSKWKLYVQCYSTVQNDGNNVFSIYRFTDVSTINVCEREESLAAPVCPEMETAKNQHSCYYYYYYYYYRSLFSLVIIIIIIDFSFHRSLLLLLLLISLFHMSLLLLSLFTGHYYYYY